LFKISIQSVSLWHVHVYMYCIPNRFIPSIFLFSTFMMISTYLKILYPFFFPFLSGYIHCTGRPIVRILYSLTLYMIRSPLLPF
jgi:hypothetical protein